MHTEPTMPQYYTNFDSSGNVSGFYYNLIHGDNIPETARPITPEEWQLYTQNSGLYILDGEMIREKTEKELAAEVIEQQTTQLTSEQQRLADIELLLADIIAGGGV